MFGSNERRRINPKKDSVGVDLDKVVAETQQHSGTSLNEGLKKEEGEMFGNPYGENDYNVPGHEDDERLENKSQVSKFNGKTYTKKFVPIEEVENKIGSSEDSESFEDQDLSSRAEAARVKNSYDSETEFMREAIKKLDAAEFKTLFSFFKKMEEGEGEEDNSRESYLGSEFRLPAKSIPRNITELIKKVNGGGDGMIKSLKDEYNEAGEKIGSEERSVPADSIKVNIFDRIFKRNKNKKKKLVSLK